VTMDPQSDRFMRNKMFFGLEGFQKLRESFVAVVGLGGVGSYAAEALARAGVGRLRIIDCDKVKPSDINRQLIALSTTVGMHKAQAAADRLAAINPELSLEPVQAFFHFDTADELITGDIDFVIDAIDSLNPKGQLIKHCTEKNVPMISALGASSRTDPYQVQLTTLNKTVNCPLARALRRHLRTKGIRDDVTVIYSPEAPRQSLLQVVESLAESDDAYLRGRLRLSLPSIPTLPGIVGLMAANYVIFELQKRG
jgi:tRNA A37 threonylcarbamoyladenosine dehydratase